VKTIRTPLLTITAICAALLIAFAQQKASNAESSAQAAKADLPPDINPVTRNRVAPVKPEELDDYGKKVTGVVAGEGRAITNAGGPSSIRAHSPHVLEYMDMGNEYLRYKAGIEPRLVELTILVAARAMDNQYEWTAHEKSGLKAGLTQDVIDIVKYRKPVTGLPEKEASIIQIGREAYGDHKVSSATYARGLKAFGETGLVNVVSLMAHYSATAVLLTVFDQHLAANDKSTLPVP